MALFHSQEDFSRISRICWNTEIQHLVWIFVDMNSQNSVWCEKVGGQEFHLASTKEKDSGFGLILYRWVPLNPK